MSGRLDEWPAPDFASLLARTERVVVLFHGAGPGSLAAVRDFEEAAPESLAICVRAHLQGPRDPRRREHGIPSAPTLVYFEKGEELERLEGEPRSGLAPGAIHAFLEHVEALNEDVDPIPRWLTRRRQPTSRRP